MHRAPVITVVVSLVPWGGCGPLAGLDAVDSTTSATGSGPGTAGGASTSTESTGPQNTDADFIVPPDGGGVDFECDPFSGEGCGPGDKCMPWDNSGGSSWNATRCSPIAPDPAAPGEPCTVQGNAVSGVDGCEYPNVCDPGLFCANALSVEGCEGSLGCCAPFCTPGEANACPGLAPNTECVPYYDEAAQPIHCNWGEIGICIVPE